MQRVAHGSLAGNDLSGKSLLELKAMGESADQADRRAAHQEWMRRVRRDDEGRRRGEHGAEARRLQHALDADRRAPTVAHAIVPGASREREAQRQDAPREKVEGADDGGSDGPPKTQGDRALVGGRRLDAIAAISLDALDGAW